MRDLKNRAIGTCLFTLVFFHNLPCFSQNEKNDLVEVRIDGVTKLVSSDGYEIILDSEEGFTELMVNGMPTKIAVMTPEVRMSKIPRQLSYDQHMKMSYQGSMKFSKPEFQNNQQEVKQPFNGLVPVVNAMIQSPDGLKTIEVVDNQKVRLEAAFKVYQRERSKIQQDSADLPSDAKERFREMVVLEAETGQIYVDILLPHQLTEIREWLSGHRNFIGALTETPIGEIYGLDKGQKKRVAQAAIAAMEELEKAIEDTRMKLKTELFEELNSQQREALDRDFGRIIERQLFESSCNGLIELFGEKKIPTPAKPEPIKGESR